MALKDMEGVMWSPRMLKVMDELSEVYSRNNLACMIRTVCESGRVFKASKGMVGIPGNCTTWREFAQNRPARFGSQWPDRVDFWAQDKKGLDGVAFFHPSHGIVIPLGRAKRTGHLQCLNLSARTIVYLDDREVLPLFPKAVRNSLPGGPVQTFNEFQSLVGEFAKLRDEWSSSAHDDAVDAFMKCHASMLAAADSAKSMEETLKSVPKEEGKKMKFIDTQKDVLSEVGKLQAGRASNKVIKEAVRPLIKMAFKPSFMQRIGMVLFGIQDPTEKFLKSPASDFVCAQLAQLIIDTRGIDNEKVRMVVKSGIVYSGNKLADEIPFEETIDKVVAELSSKADGVFDRLKK